MILNFANNFIYELLDSGVMRKLSVEGNQV